MRTCHHKKTLKLVFDELIEQIRYSEYQNEYPVDEFDYLIEEHIQILYSRICYSIFDGPKLINTGRFWSGAYPKQKSPAGLDLASLVSFSD